jgi:exodeoxyribonuclease V beta subunit
MNSVAPGTTSLDSAGVLAFPLQGLQLIEASAGTGKTYTIANLYLRHVLNGRKVSEILVVTFTEAATDELRGRIRARLYAAMRCLQSAGKPEDEFLATLANSLDESGDADTAIRQLALAVRSMDEAAIFTIHGFCNRALNEFPFSSSQPFGLEMLTNDEALKNEAVRDWWRRTLYPCPIFDRCLALSVKRCCLRPAPWMAYCPATGSPARC